MTESDKRNLIELLFPLLRERTYGDTRIAIHGRREERRHGRLPRLVRPATFGHLDIIGRAANVFDNVVVGVVNQPVRKRQTLFTAEERVGFITAEVAEYGNVQVKPLILCSSISPGSTAPRRSSRD